MKPWLHLARISNLPTVWTNVTAAWLLAGGALNDPRLYWLIAAGSLLYTGGMILNDAADAKFDREHRKERPIPSGQVKLGTVWTVGIAMLIGGAILAVGFGANAWITAALVAAILFYDLYHKPWAGSVLVMGACRTLLYLMAASAWTETSGSVLPAGLALGSYIVGITVAARLEHRNGALPVASSLFALVLLTAPGILFVTRFATTGGQAISLIILATFAFVVVSATRFLRQGGPAIGRAVGLLLPGIAIVDALAVSTVSVPLAFAFAALAPLLRLWQRWVAAT